MGEKNEHSGEGWMDGALEDIHIGPLYIVFPSAKRRRLSNRESIS